MPVFGDDTDHKIIELREAASKVAAYSDGSPEIPALPDQELASAIYAGIGRGTIIVDRHGLIPSVERALVATIHAYMQKLHDIRKEFDARFQPFQVQIDDSRKIEAEIKNLEEDRERQINDEKRKLDTDPIGQKYHDTKDRYDRAVDRHGRHPNLKAVSSRFLFEVSPAYAVVMLLIGVAEWFINYDTLFLFFGIPVIAIGATAILGICLAIIAHQHGADLKQWTKKFGPSAEAKGRPWGAFALATVGLVALLAIVGWMRYQSLMSVIESQTSANIVGTSYSVQIDPEREIVISLGANFLAWLVGVFISYFCHDTDPDFMRKALDYRPAERAYLRRQGAFEKRVARIKRAQEEKLEEERNRLHKYEASAALKEAASLLGQVNSYEERFWEHARTFWLLECNRAKRTIVAALSEKEREVSILKEGKDETVRISLADYEALPLLSDVRPLLGGENIG